MEAVNVDRIGKDSALGDSLAQVQLKFNSKVIISLSAYTIRRQKQKEVKLVLLCFPIHNNYHLEEQNHQITIHQRYSG